MSYHIVRGSALELDCEAVVNAANSSLAMGGGVCGQIFRKAGPTELRRECDAIGCCPTGKAVITSGYRLSKYVIHAVGPIYSGSDADEQLLRSAYRCSLELVRKYDIQSVAFPLISAGIYGYPREDAFRIADEEIRSFMRENDDVDVYLSLFDRKVTYYHRDYYPELEEKVMLTAHPVLTKSAFLGDMLETSALPGKIEIHLGETFSEMLLRLIDEKGMTDPEAYKGANVDRKLFSKIRSNRDYRPSRNTVMAFCISLKLSEDEARDLLATAGYAFSGSSVSDAIIRYHLLHGIYDIYEVNLALFNFGQPTL